MGPKIAERYEIKESFQNPLMNSLFEPVLLAAMIICLAISLNQLIMAIKPDWAGIYFLAGMFFVIIEAIYSYRTIMQNRRIRDKLYRFRLAEWICILTCMKIMTYLNKSWSMAIDDIHYWITYPIHFVTLDFCTYAFFAFFLWQLTTTSMKTLDRLFDPFMNASLQIDPQQQLFKFFYIGGIILIFISGLAQYLYRTGQTVSKGFNQLDSKGDLINILIYFILGLILLGRTHLRRNLQQWRRQKIDIFPNLTHAWIKYGFISIAIITLIALLLPTSHTLGFLSSIKFIIQYGFSKVINSITFIWGIIVFVLIWFLSVFSFQESPIQEKHRTELPSPDQNIIPASPPDAASSIIFWIIISAIIVYLLSIYFKERPGLLKWIKTIRLRFSLVSWLNIFWKWLKEVIKSTVKAIPELIPGSIKYEKTPQQPKRRWLKMNDFSARGKILYYYFSFLRRVEKSGLKRRKDQTPNEYEPELNGHLPDLKKEIALLTEAFVRARYSQDDLDNDQASLAKTSWQKIRRILRKKKK